MENVQLEHENVTALVLVTLRDGVEEGRRFSNEPLNISFCHMRSCIPIPPFGSHCQVIYIHI
ncbi:unnamed protein product [Spirodela intermedia]|uniref:Uncharacterized protein n=1 Tax=Spirodela intermedia TaxID=51605 RepID=A0ABN7EDJ1_SPIIN|nr:unnamed protein product [Spirodela intermedia]